jgi:hypothetical protein
MGKGYVLHRVVTAKRQRQNMIQRWTHGIRPRKVTVYRRKADIARPLVALVNISGPNIICGELQLQRPALLVVRLAALIPSSANLSAFSTSLTPPMQIAKALSSNASLAVRLRAADGVIGVPMPVAAPL